MLWIKIVIERYLHYWYLIAKCLVNETFLFILFCNFVLVNLVRVLITVCNFH